MKRRIIFFFVLVLSFTNTSFSQSVFSDIMITGTISGAETEVTEMHTGSPKTVNAKIIIGPVEGNPVEFYSVNISRINTFPDSCNHLSHNYTFNDEDLVSGIRQSDFDGNSEFHNLMNEVEAGVPSEFELSQNYPNPFNPSTTIKFDMAIEGFVSLKIFNSSGKEVATLLNEPRAPGHHSVNFNASDLSSGIYYYKLETNNFSKVMKMALIK